ncbi:DUF2505 domain-containing protein [Corynebacterium mendelii]|uniref:DUF2505 domain-containing protein n=1 Tax=Corynebacterium mendelii TaxID=2765362 RepID=A0A939IV50_9CORY|nr:DUF2505 domain-containing protein [Corynebacterium mendelii]MBN9643866.1 DUF2505 domain-containing protein [Corynebacterium mendelii]
MSKRTEHTVSIPFPPAKVAEAFRNKEYWEYNVKNLSTEPGEVHEFTEGENTCEAVLYEVMPMELLPEAVQAMVSHSLKIKRVVSWNDLDGDSFSGHFNADVKGAPVEFKADMSLSGDENSTTISYANEVTVNIPFMGSAIEPKVADALAELSKKEADLTADFIRNNS